MPKFRLRPKKYKTRERPPVEIKKKRNNNIRYFLDINDERLRVCKTMFLNTFDIGEAVVESAIKKTNDKGDLIDVDRRGAIKNLLEYLQAPQTP